MGRGMTRFCSVLQTTQRLMPHLYDLGSSCKCPLNRVVAVGMCHLVCMTGRFEESGVSTVMIETIIDQDSRDKDAQRGDRRNAPSSSYGTQHELHGNRISEARSAAPESPEVCCA
jgi:hypothetical protein